LASSFCVPLQAKHKIEISISGIYFMRYYFLKGGKVLLTHRANIRPHRVYNLLHST
jgi:hypothetical protein